MPLYLVRYRYTNDAEAQAAVRPAHRAWLQSLGTTIVGSGPTADNGAALVFDAAAEAEVHALVDQDPFTVGGFIASREVAEWTLVLGRWSEPT